MEMILVDEVIENISSEKDIIQNERNFLSMILPVDVFENQNYLLHDNRDELDLLLNVQMVVYDYHKNHEIFH